MTLRDRLQTALKGAMRARAADRLSTLRLINAAIKDREIANRGDGTDAEVSDIDIMAILGRMVKQRQESARAFEVGGRMELAEKELAEVQVIEEFLPRQLDADEVDAAIAEAVAEAGAASIRDMGRVIAALKAKYTGQMDFGAVGPMVKARLS
ncbi:MAG: GatB/YqeY domain-containing protein [Rhodoferax sp.]|nr:GatB/YqeY domain-containing protein [Pseudorhodobacter sp.]